MDYKEYAVRLTQELVRIPSISQNEEEIAKYLVPVLEQIGLRTEMECVSEHSWNVYAETRKASSRRLVLGGHIDVVAPGEGWSTDPFEAVIKDGRIYGRGCLDMKGGLACQIAVLKELADRGELGGMDIELLALCDEERYSIGAYAYAERMRKREGKLPAFGLFAEPHFDEIIHGATGKTLFRIETAGRAGHAARPETGINAVDLMARFLTALREEWKPQYERGETASLCVLRIESDYAGYSLRIPDHCTCLLNKQFFLDESREDFIRALHRIYKAAVGEGELIVTPDYPNYTSCFVDPQDENLKLLQKAAAMNGRTPELMINQSVSDGNVLAGELGIPTVLYGPKGERLHRENEYVEISSMHAYMEDLKNFIYLFFQE